MLIDVGNTHTHTHAFRAGIEPTIPGLERSRTGAT